MKQAMLLPPYTLHQQLYLVRFFAGLTQMEMIRYLGIAQGWLSKMEKGQGEITAPILNALRQHFAISSDAFLEGNVPYLKLIKSFSNTAIMPRKYRGSDRGRVRMLYGMVSYLEKTAGAKKVAQLFDELDIPTEILAEPRMRIDHQVFVDLLDLAVEKGLLPKSPWSVISQASLTPAALGEEFVALSESDSPEEVFRRFSKIASVFSDDLGYALRPLGARSLSLETVHHLDTRISPEANAHVLKALLQLKTALLKQVGRDFGKKVVTITQKDEAAPGPAEPVGMPAEKLICNVEW